VCVLTSFDRLRVITDSARCKYTCQLFAASFGHEVVDAQQWAEWGVDYLKLDECYGAVQPATWTGWDDPSHVTPIRSDPSCHDLDSDPLHRLGVMRDALNASGRPIFFSNELPAGWMHPGPMKPNQNPADMPAHANMWRISGDISNHWNSILNNLDHDEPWAKFAGPGSLNDPDSEYTSKHPLFACDLF
jgi:alpha-galactosidase